MSDTLKPTTHAGCGERHRPGTDCPTRIVLPTNVQTHLEDLSDAHAQACRGVIELLSALKDAGRDVNAAELAFKSVQTIADALTMLDDVRGHLVEGLSA